MHVLWGRGTIMVRTMLFAFASLVGVGTMIAMEVGTPPRVGMRASEPPALSTVGIGASHDTLTKADRLEITYVRNDVPIQPVLPAQLIAPAETMPVRPQPATKLIGRPSHDPIARKLAAALPRPRPKPKNVMKKDTKDTPKNIIKSATNSTANGTKRAANTDRAKLVLEPCHPNALGSFLKVLNLSSGCQT
jgi:outer membrane biosynthesis protein TonB